MAPLDRLERLKVLAQIAAAVAVPIVLAIAGWLVQRTVSDAGLKKDYVQMSLGLLQQKPSEETKELRQWAIAVLDKHSPVPIPEALKQQLVARQIASAGFAPMGPLEGRTNRAGSDLAISGFQVNGAEECSELCSKDAKCKAMTFVKHLASHGGICWLKDRVPPARSSEAMTSAVKLISQQDQAASLK
jgi:hypothetical protein